MGQSRPTTSPPPVVPLVAGVAALERALLIQQGADDEARVLPRRVKMNFARGSHERMPVKNDHSPALLSRQNFEPPAQVNFLGDKQLVAKAADRAEGRRFTENE